MRRRRQCRCRIWLRLQWRKDRRSNPNPPLLFRRCPIRRQSWVETRYSEGEDGTEETRCGSAGCGAAEEEGGGGAYPLQPTTTPPAPMTGARLRRQRRRKMRRLLLGGSNDTAAASATAGKTKTTMMTVGAVARPDRFYGDGGGF